jgi:PKD repeat protein
MSGRVIVMCLVALLCLTAAPLWASAMVYSFPMDSDPGWARDSQWSFTSGPTCGDVFVCGPPAAYTGSNVFTLAPGTSYPTDMGTQVLTTDALDCTNLTTVSLRFWRWMGMTDNTTAAVQVSSDGSTWTDVWSQVAWFTDDAWTECVYDISDLAAGEPTVYVRWTMTVTPTLDCSGSCWGWTLDDIQIWGDQPTIYSFSFDTDPGWTTEGQWEFGMPQGVGGDPASGYSGMYVYGYNLSGTYVDFMPAYSLTTTALNCTGFKDVKLRFWRWLGVESNSYDHALVQVSNDGLSWTTVWANGAGTIEEVAWTQVEYDISSVADGQPAVYVRWVMGSTDGSVVYSGWNIDDVEIIGLPATEILGWVPYADLSGEWPNMLDALSSQYTYFNVTETTTLDPAELRSQLVGKHVFVAPESDDASEAELAAAGAAFSEVLREFAQGGGTVIVAGGYEGESMGSFLTSSELLDDTWAADYYSSEALPVLDSSHPLASGLGPDVAAMDSTAAYQVGPEATVVVGDGSGNAVVAARQMGAGAVVVIGYDYYAWDDSAAIILANAVQYPRASKSVLLYDNGEPYNHVAMESLSRLSVPFSVSGPTTFGTDLGAQPWSLAVVDAPDIKPAWDPFLSYIGAGGHALLSTWDLESETDLCSAFGVSAGGNLSEVPAVYDWATDIPLFSFRESVPTTLSGWSDLWGSDANELTVTAPGALALAGFTTPTGGLAAIVGGSGKRTIIDGFLWDDGNQDSNDDGIEDVVQLVMNEIQLLLTVPFPDFVASVTTGDAPLPVQFTDETDASVVSWYWDFGDGSTSTEQNPSHTYTVPGLYTVALSATNINGSDMKRRVDYIGVGVPPPPVADFSAVPTGGNAPLNVAFTDESTGALISAWEWDFGDSGTSTLQSPTHQYTIAGTYTVSLLITDIGGTDTETKTGYIHVGHAGMANFSATPTEGVVALDVTFTDLSSGDVIGWAWSFGDGGISTAQNPTHQFTAPGKYTVSLVASDDYTSDTETKVDYIKVGFPDTPPDFWAFEEILDCVDAGVVTGYGDGSYHPDIPIDRALMATYIARALAGGDDNVPDGPGTATFPDVATGFWAFKYVEYAVSHNAVQGYEDLNYHPEFVVDRDQMAVFVARAVAGGEASVPDGPAAPTFTDVATDFWAYKHIEYCADQNIVSGYEGGAYHPEYEVTRGQMAVYIAKALSLLP